LAIVLPPPDEPAREQDKLPGQPSTPGALGYEWVATTDPRAE